MTRTGALLSVLLLAGGLSARDIQESGTPVSVIVTVPTHKAAPAPQLSRGDVLVSQNKHRLEVTGLEPLRAQGDLQLWILIDDGSTTNLGLQLPELKKFVLAQQATTQIGVGYMRNGYVQAAQAMTSDHDRAAKSLRLPMGTPGISASPYIALTDLIHKWPAGAAREVLMVSSGIDPEYGAGPDNPYLDTAIDTAQRAGVVVYSIYYSGAGRVAHDYRQLFWGQNYLSKLSDQTGGELFWLGTENPVSISPYLNDLNRRFAAQYLLTFLAQPQTKSGFQDVKIKAEPEHITVVGPAKVYVPAK